MSYTWPIPLAIGCIKPRHQLVKTVQTVVHVTWRRGGPEPELGPFGICERSTEEHHLIEVLDAVFTLGIELSRQHTQAAITAERVEELTQL